MATRVVPPEMIARARAMHRSGMSKKRIANQLGLSRDTVKRYVAGELPKHADEADVVAVETQVTQRVSTNMDLFLVKATDVMATDEFVAHMAERPKDLAVGVGIVTERRELLAGRATDRRVVALQVSLVRPGALKELAAEVIEGDYRTLPAQTGPSEPRDGPLSDSDTPAVP